MNFFKKLVDKADGEVYIIAEACDNHMGSMEIAKSLARAAKYCNCNAVKFQHHIADEEMLRTAEMSDNFDEHLYDFLIKNSLTLENHIELKEYCDSIGITYLCTPFSYRAAKEIVDIVPFFKVGSGEFIDHWFIDKLAKLGKPILFSSGMCTQTELDSNIEYLMSKSDIVDFSIMNCLSEYPPKMEDMNLSVIKTLINKYPSVVIGHSDHTQTNYTSVIALSLGARIFEKHLTLSNFIYGPDKDVSLVPEQFKKLCSALRGGIQTLGNKKTIQEKEVQVRQWAYRSIVSSKTLEKDYVIQESDLCTKRPGTGIPSKNYSQVIGRKVKNRIEKNSIILWEDLHDH